MDHHQQQQLSPKTHHHFFSFHNKKELVCAVSFLIILLSSFMLLDLVGPFDPRFLLRFGFLNSPQNLTSKNHQESSLKGLGCDFYRGRWVRDESYKIRSYTETCPFLDPGFRCVMCGRKDVEYLNWRWQPENCDITKFNASELLERARNGQIVFAGDSVARNQWESLLCMLAQGVSNKSSIYEENGNPITKHKGFLSMRFSEYNLTVGYYRAPFLVAIGHATRKPPPKVRVTLKLDQLHWYSRKWVEADVLVFSAGHWWNEFKTIKSGIYFEEGGNVNMSMTVMEAFERSLQTWKSWTKDKINPKKTHVFYRGYSPSHYRQNGTWNNKGRCDLDTQPAKDYRMLEPEPVNNQYISKVIKQMEHENRTVHFLNITYMTQFRYDGHPGTHREPGTPVYAPQDCSHWCLPGIPDVWNEILYAHLMSVGFRTKR